MSSNKVFISHKNTDTLLAERVAYRVQANGMEIYLDTIDDALVKDGPELANLLLDRMGQCQQLIAVVSPDTKILGGFRGKSVSAQRRAFAWRPFPKAM